MKSTLIMLALCASFAGAAHATDWRLLVESEEGVRWLIDLDATELQKVDRVWYLAGSVRLVEPTGITDLAALTRLDSCPKAHGGLVLGFPNNVRRVYWWTGGGQRVYDGIGRGLCRAIVLKNGAPK